MNNNLIVKEQQQIQQIQQQREKTMMDIVTRLNKEEQIAFDALSCFGEIVEGEVGEVGEANNVKGHADDNKIDDDEKIQPPKKQYKSIKPEIPIETEINVNNVAFAIPFSPIVVPVVAAVGNSVGNSIGNSPTQTTTTQKNNALLALRAYAPKQSVPLLKTNVKIEGTEKELSMINLESLEIKIDFNNNISLSFSSKDDNKIHTKKFSIN